ncbi:hypothetical protein [Lutispora thermophila]|uniref:Uncharacterized protein n=1 Tax=Lutispora thermophila DSM 19022 TaxID=1122184 RepID=A0A1M6IFL0_9FIRM|nr:hypothetical protein [Lutispora thermophila]SHJ33106.1 hypothetical protein SAMN02745176_03228 [Lutispora thermophila DSM 19022]
MINPVNVSGMEKPMNTYEKKDLKQENKMETTVEQEAYIVDIGNTPEKKATYDNPGVVKPDIKRIEQLKKEADDALRPLRQMVEELLKKQGMYFKDANFKPNEGEMVEIDDETRAEAQRLISDEGEYGIENTANRLFEFAKAVSGNDKTKLNELKAAIEQGYKAAEEAFGGELPEICKKTLARTMEKLDQWAASEEE